jgi:hypothetical protein
VQSPGSLLSFIITSLLLFPDLINLLLKYSIRKSSLLFVCPSRLSFKFSFLLSFFLSSFSCFFFQHQWISFVQLPSYSIQHRQHWE